MKTLSHLFHNNKKWATEITASDPTFFQRLAKIQNPEYLWIGCADSRVPANQIVGLDPGELFVHRNIANLVIHTDLNCLSVMQYALDVLKVKHIIICGHYGCGGVLAALTNQEVGLATNWLRHLQDIAHDFEEELNAIDDLKMRTNRLCELNVARQVLNVCRTTVVQDAWAKGHTLSVHGWCYSLEDGLIRDLKICINDKSELSQLKNGT